MHFSFFLKTFSRKGDNLFFLIRGILQFHTVHEKAEGCVRSDPLFDISVAEIYIGLGGVMDIR